MCSLCERCWMMNDRWSHNHIKRWADAFYYRHHRWNKYKRKGDNYRNKFTKRFEHYGDTWARGTARKIMKTYNPNSFFDRENWGHNYRVKQV